MDKNPMLHANFMAPCFTELEILPINVSHCGIRIFHLFCSYDLDRDSMTFIYELDLETHQICKYELPTSRLSKVIV